ncbi:hypothetical protein EDB86DRAFT_3087166 [Lactarius hatsudake]|nr:hypothetical protein EDB86DRAFT_3087166 [Lactarius hatsudake]
MSLPTVQNLTPSRRGDYHLIFAVIVILKHATFLRLSKLSPQSALTHAEVDYRKANIDSSIRQYLTAPSQEHSDELFAGFIMAADVTCTHIGVPGDSTARARFASDPLSRARLGTSNFLRSADAPHHYIIALTDANFGQYRITEADLGRVMNASSESQDGVVLNAHFPNLYLRRWWTG